jgi:hypothetical protein
MKRIIGLTLILLSIATAAWAIKIQWTSNPPTDLVTHYTVYEKVGSTYTAAATVTPTASPNQIWLIPGPSPGPHIYAVSATNLRGESAKSADVLLPDLPTAPTGLTIVP